MCWSAVSSCFTLGPSVLVLWALRCSNRPRSCFKSMATPELIEDTARFDTHELSEAINYHTTMTALASVSAHQAFSLTFSGRML